ncbi:hypothetical protein HZY97_06770 [Sphingomonas sp. R-74633]|uniref:hypothetical protein n=1 Tax=Sphingomonas sp. R-74633 TaxID=2751188 RepID=UPI0015D3E5D3|nr:hypothetical protein [Sphingomonas sp. R-74633]NYT40452.1 hypothetical protein [Sphingomonas sp. R-74633]
MCIRRHLGAEPQKDRVGSAISERQRLPTRHPDRQHQRIENQPIRIGIARVRGRPQVERCGGESLFSSADWALDISRAKFPNGATFEALPGDKIVRDRKTQALIRRNALKTIDWKALDYGQTAIDIAIGWFENGSLFDAVVVVPRSNSKYREADAAVIEMLRREGIAELD